MCASKDGDLEPDEKLEEEGSTDHHSQSLSNPEGPTQTSDDSSRSDIKNHEKLSRRQRKNRTRVMKEQHNNRDVDDDTSRCAISRKSSQRSHRLQINDENRYFNLRRTHSTGSSSSSSSTSLTSHALNTSQTHNKKLNRNNSNKTTTNNFSNSKASQIIKKIDKKNKNINLQNNNTIIEINNVTLGIYLRQYILNGIDLTNFGYPVECTYYPGCAIIVNRLPHPRHHRPHSRANNQNINNNNNKYKYNLRQHSLDVNAREFIPSQLSSLSYSELEGDSGNGSTSSSLSNSDIDQESSSDSDKFFDTIESSSSSSSSSDYSEKASENLRSSPVAWNNNDQSQAVEHPCVRCFKKFSLNGQTNEYITKDKCIYHWGKMRNVHHNSNNFKWDCCNGKENSNGCTVGNMHVWTGITQGCNGPFDGYVRTKPSRVISCDGNYGIYALDCEMCFTKNGLELVKVSVVDIKKKIMYDTLVKPDNEIVDYNTRFSGITESMLNKTNKNLKDVQNDLMSFITAETILIGHGLENDLKALKILHTTVIDTCVVFPHYLGYPFRNSLKTLARTILNKQIQIREHDSIEDAKVVVDLILERVKHDNKISLQT